MTTLVPLWKEMCVRLTSKPAKTGKWKKESHLSEFISYWCYGKFDVSVEMELEEIKVLLCTQKYKNL